MGALRLNNIIFKMILIIQKLSVICMLMQSLSATTTSASTTTLATTQTTTIPTSTPISTGSTSISHTESTSTFTTTSITPQPTGSTITPTTSSTVTPTTSFTISPTTSSTITPTTSSTITPTTSSTVTPTTSSTVTPTTSSTITPTTSSTITPTTGSTVTPTTGSTVTPTTSSTVTPITGSTITPTTSFTITPATSSTVTPTTSSTITPTTSSTVTPTTSFTVSPTTSSIVTPTTSSTITPTTGSTVIPTTSSIVTPTTSLTVTPTTSSTITPTTSSTVAPITSFTVTPATSSTVTPTTSYTITPTTGSTVTPTTSSTVTPTTSSTSTPTTSSTVTPTTSFTVTPTTGSTVTPTTGFTVTPTTSSNVTPTTSSTVTPTTSSTGTPTTSSTVTPATSSTLTPTTSSTITPATSSTITPATSSTSTPTTSSTITPTTGSTVTPTTSSTSTPTTSSTSTPTTSSTTAPTTSSTNTPTECEEGFTPIDGNCTEVIGLFCYSQLDCLLDHSDCDTNSSSCACADGYIHENSICVLVIGLFCYSQLDCLLDHSDCDTNSSSCACADGYIQENSICVLAQNEVEHSLGNVTMSIDQGYVNGQHTVFFKCSFDVYDNFIYKIIWFASKELYIELGNLTSTEADENLLSDAEIFGRFDSLIRANPNVEFTISCTASVFNNSGQNLLETKASASLVPIEVSTKSVTFVRGQDAQFSVKLNLPFGCASGTDDCKLQYILYDPNDSYDCRDSSIAVRSATTCGAEVVGATMATIGKLSTVNTTTIITITAKNNNKYRLRGSFSLILKTNVVGNANSLWSNRFISNIEVTVQENNTWMGSYCSSHVDPHMKTADGSWRFWYTGGITGYYENQNVDEFVMLRHKTLPIEVQTITKPCNRGWATCSCSVTMRAGGDVFTINHCNGHLTDFLASDDGILKVYEISSQQYEIIFPTGIIVTVYIMPYYEYTMNIDIYLSPSDIDQVEGLCGNFNGNPNDDFQIRGTSTISSSTWRPDDFSLSWGLINTQWETESLLIFNNYNNLERWHDEKKVCVCPAETATTHGEALCSASETDTCTSSVYRRGKLLKVIVGFRTNNVERLAKMMQKWKQTSFGTQRKKRQDSNAISKENATLLCKLEFDKCPAYASKDQITIIDVNATLDNCALDVMLDGKVTWVSPHCDAYTQNIQTEIARNVNFSEANPVLTKNMETFCPGNCNEHGNCTNGTCSCDDGYGTHLCLVNLREPLEIEEITGDGVCDRSTGDACSDILIVANGFVETAQCRISINVAATDGVFIFKTSFQVPCIYFNYNAVYAPTEQGRTRRDVTNTTAEIAEQIGVAVSNDGVHFGDIKYVIVLDGSCQEVATDSNGVQIVLLKSGFCYIAGVCYTTGSSNTLDSCYKCKPNVYLFQWTNECETSDASANNLAMILGIVGGLLGLFIVVVLVGFVVRYHYKKTRNSVQSSTFQVDNTPMNLRFNHQRDLFARKPVEAWVEKSKV